MQSPIQSGISRVSSAISSFIIYGMNSFSIPVIDVSSLVSTSSSLDAKRTTAQQIRDACINVGFFYIENHHIDAELVKNTFAEMKRLFDLPLEAKAEKKLNEIFRGYFALGEEITNKLGDWKEGYDLGLELPLDHPDVLAKKPLHGPNQWPLLRGFREAMTTYSDAVRHLGSCLMKGIAMSLGLNENYFTDHYGDEPVIFFRLLHYLPSSDQKLGVGSHTDYGCLTILAQDDVGGLQIQDKNGKWIDATPIPNTFVVNIGDMLQIWSGDLYKATVHRVVTNPSKERYSMAFCYEPNFDAMINPLPGYNAENKYNSAINYGTYVMKKLNNSFPSYTEAPK